MEPNDSILTASVASFPIPQVPEQSVGFLVNGTINTLTDGVDTYAFTAARSRTFEFHLCGRTVTNGCGEITTSEETPLGIAPDIAINPQPSDSELCEGETVALLSGVINGSATFQWFKDDVPIPGVTAGFLFIQGATPEDSGIYHAEAHGPCNSVVSDDAVVNVIECNGSP